MLLKNARPQTRFCGLHFHHLPDPEAETSLDWILASSHLNDLTSRVAAANLPLATLLVQDSHGGVSEISAFSCAAGWLRPRGLTDQETQTPGTTWGSAFDISRFLILVQLN